MSAPVRATLHSFRLLSLLARTSRSKPPRMERGRHPGLPDTLTEACCRLTHEPSSTDKRFQSTYQYLDEQHL